MMRNYRWLAVSAGLAALLCIPSTTWAQVAPNLGVAQQFGALGTTGVTGSAGAGTVVNGDVGSYPTATITNFPPSRTVAPFTVHSSADGVVQQAHSDAGTAYNFLAAQGGSVLNNNLSTNGVIGPGVYSLGAADLPASTTLVLNGAGIFIFNVASSLTMNGSSVVTGTANPCNVYWRVGSSATLNGNSFIGTVIAAVSVTVGGGTVSGRVLTATATGGAVTMPTGGNTIGGCSTPAAPACPIITIAPPTAPTGRVGVAYSQTITASGGTAPYTFSLQSGTLPAGLTLTAAGVLSGTPTTAGSSTFTIRATDASSCFAEITYAIVVAAAATCPVITITPATLSPGRVGVAFSQQLTASGGTAPYTFSVLSGALPAGLTLSASGLIAGTPTTAASTTVIIQATDGAACPGVVTYTIVIAAAACPVITIAPPTMPPGQVGVAFSQQITATGGTGAYTFSVLSGTLPTGLTLTTAGLLAGTPTAIGISTLVIQATDGSGCPAVITYTITVTAAVPTLPQVVLLLLAIGLSGIGYFRLRRNQAV